ncbi:ExeM/NucH family extracellular endonuclease [Arcanobacterium phocae]|uniref:ExeM/NucH family extracellular endonuclease n=1 Tax=Arcanobacterium phocae TaxID=131112 RepID=UPI001C0EFE32|nr:ExeM/NucH family extracellular endonuclease [Arcanobacterium phocae]
MKLSRSMKIAAVFTASLLALPAATQPAVAAGAVESKGADHLVINEVYVDGTQTKGTYRDYVELYNPTPQPIDLSNYVLQGFANSGNKAGGTTELSGQIQPNGYFLVTAANGNPTTDLNADQQNGKFNMSASDKGASIGLFAKDSVPKKLTAGTPAIDLVGWGSKAVGEKTTISKVAKDTNSFQRNPVGTDTDNNSVDFTIAEATPMNAKGEDAKVSIPSEPDPSPNEPNPTPSEPSEPGETPTPEPAPDPQQILTIADIQGEGTDTPYEKQIVTTRGVITAVYPYGGFQGFYMQTPGSGGNEDKTPQASDGIFVYVGNFSKLVDKDGAKPGPLAIGDYLEVTGIASERYGLTQISVYKKGNENQSATVTKLTKDETIVAPQPVEIERVPDDPAEREKLESMLVKITGKYTISANYLTNRHGRLDLAPGKEPFQIPSDATADKSKWQELADKIERERIALDDGASMDYTDFGKQNNRWPNYKYPVPYLDVNNSLRVGTVITLPQPMILDYRANSVGYQKYENRWNLQPTRPLTDANDLANKEWTKWVEFTSTRRPAPQFDQGNVTITSFNVLNYFTTLGKDTPGCKPYAAYDGTGLTNRRCDPRGAFSDEAFQMQQSKIVKAINELNSSVVGLEEIENSIKFGDNRDAAIANLVTELNKDAGSEKWAYVPSPAAEKLPDLDAQDVIRLAFIYQKDTIKPVGDSHVLYNGTQWAYARQPLAQKFQAIKDGADEGKPFVVVINHLKSKGSDKDTVPNDGYQGNNNHMRVNQVTEMATWVQKNFAQDPVFVIGDLNSYSHEDPLTTLETKFGYTSIAEAMKVKNHSYQFGGVVGSLDHALGNAAAMKMVKAADVWNVNAMEPVAFEYARWNYNVNYKNLFDADSPYRSSDHDPIKVAIDTRNSVPWTELTPATPVDPEPQPEPQPQPDPEPQPEATVVTPKASAVNPQASDPAACKITPFVTIEPIEGVTYQVTVDGKQLKPVDGNANKFEYPYGKTVKVVATLKDGYKLAEGAQTEWSWTAPTREELKCSVPWTELTPATPAPQDPTPQDPTPQDPTPVPDQPGQEKKDSGKKDSKSGKSGLAKTGIETSGLAGLAVIAMIAGGAIVARRRNA